MPRKFRGWRDNLDVLWWLQSDIHRLWRWLLSPFDLYQAAAFMPAYDYTAWHASKWGYARCGLFMFADKGGSVARYTVRLQTESVARPPVRGR